MNVAHEDTNQKAILSIILVNWNTETLLRQCIESIYRKLGHEGNYEIVVVDNASSDGSVAMLETTFPDVILVKNNENLGFGAAVNQGQEIAKGKYYFLLNSDTELLDNDVWILVQLLEDDKSIAIATGRMVGVDHNDMPAYFSYPGFWYLVKAYTLDIIYKTGPLIRGRVRLCKNIHKGDIRVCDVDWVSGGYMLIRKEALNGGAIFDDRIFMFFEDTLLCRKIWDNGKRVVFASCALIIHVQGASVKKLKARSVWLSYSSSRIYIEDTYGRNSARAYEWIVSISWRVLYFACSLLLAVTGLERVKDKKERFLFLLSATVDS